MTNNNEQSLAAKLFDHFVSIEEKDFIPESISSPILTIMNLERFQQLAELSTDDFRVSVQNISNKIRRHENSYRSYQNELKNTPNVFSGEVDFI